VKINIPRDALVGKVMIPRGDYMVSLQSDTQQLLLVGGGKDIKIPAIRRRNEPKGKSKTIQVSFYSGGGNTWSLIVSAPKQGEWIAYIELEKEK
jgi:hypothetical protein